MTDIQTNNVTYQIVPVVDWSPLHCTAQRRRTTFFLIRLFDKTTGLEISRDVLGQEGLLRQWGHAKLDATPGEEFVEALTGHSLVPLDAAVLTAKQVLGQQPSRPQYVATWGTLECSTPKARSDSTEHCTLS